MSLGQMVDPASGGLCGHQLKWQFLPGFARFWSMMGVKFLCGLMVGMMLMTGCSLLSFGTRAEPDMIVVRNSTSAEIRQVTVWSTDTDALDGPRMASISSVPRGQSAMMGRPSNRSALPKSCRFAWVDVRGQTHAKDVDLVKVLKSSTGVEGEVMLFEIQPGNTLSVQTGTFR